jgi:Shedu protein SduA, C-terminal
MTEHPQDRDNFVFEEEPDETTFAQGRMAERTYASKSFPLPRPGSADHGEPSRFVVKVFDPKSESEVLREGEEWTIRETPAGRYQFKLLVTREAGNVKELWIQRVPAPGVDGPVRNLLSLEQPEADRLIELLKRLPLIPAIGETSVRVDDSLLRDLFADPESLSAVYHENPDALRMLIEGDASAKDVIAIAARREQVRRFRRFLEDPEFFDAEAAGSPEALWQRFFEESPWIFGVSLAGQLMTSWNPDKLEQVVAGFSVTGHGKRTDALLRTSGRVRSMVFVEIKTHRTDLLAATEYRPGCWRPSSELSGGVAQVQGTVHQASMEIGERIGATAEDGSEVPGEFTYLLRPRSFLVIGSLSQLEGVAGGDHREKIRSFELFRRNLVEPEIVTFDELLVRAEWVVGLS